MSVYVDSSNLFSGTKWKYPIVQTTGSLVCTENQRLQLQYSRTVELYKMFILFENLPPQIIVPY